MSDTVDIRRKSVKPRPGPGPRLRGETAGVAAGAASARESRAPLTRERVIYAAIALADDSGIESLSMRRLGQALGVEAMSLYNHVANKDDILDGIVEIVLGEIEPPQAGPDWKAAIRRSAISFHEALVRHRWAASLLLAPNRPSSARLSWMNALLGCLRQAGFSADMTDHAYHALDSHIFGFTLWLVQMDLDAETLPGLATEFLRQLPADELPYVAEHVHQHLKPKRSDDEGEFAFGLDLILDGLERILASA